MTTRDGTITAEYSCSLNAWNTRLFRFPSPHVAKILYTLPGTLLEPPYSLRRDGVLAGVSRQDMSGALMLHIRGKSHMRECRMYGAVQGVTGDQHHYPDSLRRRLQWGIRSRTRLQ